MKQKIEVKIAIPLILILNVFVFLLPALSHANDGYTVIKSLSVQGDIRLGNIWNVRVYQANTPDSDSPAAKICFQKESKQEECFVAERCVENTVYSFQYAKKLEEIQLLRNGSARKEILFIAQYSGGGSGTSDLVSIWEYNAREDKFANILPTIGISEQGEYKIMKIGKSGNSVFVVADYLWGDGETHFDPHRYLVRIYVYERLLSKYYLKGQFVTKRKYKSLNDVEKIDVITHEASNIKRLAQ